MDTLYTGHDLYGLRLLARDGNIGHVDDFYFDDETWTVRFMVANTGAWLIGKRVLISPRALGDLDWWGRDGLRVSLTRQEIQDSPSPPTSEPVSRTFERDYYSHYGWPLLQDDVVPEGMTDGAIDDGKRSHLRSCRDIEGYHLQAIDGDIGHIADFVVDIRTWAIRYLVIDTRNWLPGRNVLLVPAWVQLAKGNERKLRVDLPREVIRLAPEYDSSTTIDQAYEDRLMAHYESAFMSTPHPS